jgi:hypothetical protein
LIALPAQAARTVRAFEDVPIDHWAEQGVAEIVKRKLIAATPDGRFHGDQALTLHQLVESLTALIAELEALTQRSWRPEDPASEVAKRRSASSLPEKNRALRDGYGLFQAAPGVAASSFEQDRTVTRGELAGIFRHLMQVGIRKGMIAEDRLDSDRYGFLAGFPDGTIRFSEPLTRFQYAQTVHQMLSSIEERLLEPTPVSSESHLAVAKQEDEQPFLETPHGFQERHPLRFFFGIEAMRARTPLLDSTASWRGRYVAYPGEFFVMSDTHVYLSPGPGLVEEVVGMYRLPLWGPLHVQPFLGLQGLHLDDRLVLGPSAGAVMNLSLLPQLSTYGKFGAMAGGAHLMGNHELGLEFQARHDMAGSIGLTSRDLPSAMQGGMERRYGIMLGVLFSL